jgi:hypothetical protein
MCVDRPLPGFVPLWPWTRAEQLRAAFDFGSHGEASLFSRQDTILSFRVLVEKWVARLPVAQGGLGVKDHE